MAVGSETGRRNGTPHANENDDVIDEKGRMYYPIWRLHQMLPFLLVDGGMEQQQHFSRPTNNL